MTIYTTPGFTFAGQIGYSKDEIDQRLKLKANAAQVFNKEEVAERFAGIEAETQTALAILSNSVDVQTLSGNYSVTKKFNFLDPNSGAYAVTFPVTPSIGTEIIVKNTGTAGTLDITDLSSKTVSIGEVTHAVFDGTVWQDISNFV